MGLEHLSLPKHLLQNGLDGSTTTSTADPGPVDFGPGPEMDYPIMKVLDCSECHNRGIVFWRNEAGQLVGRECSCMVRRRNIRRLERSGLQDMIGRYTFDAFETPEAWQAKAKQIAEDYAEQRNGWFLAAGSVGAGKTHLCTAICARFLEAGIETQYMLWRDVATRAKAVVGKDQDAYAAIVDPLKSVRALYIDDLFKTGREKDRFGNWKSMEPTPADLSLAFEILNGRYNDKAKLTIISTEFSLNALMDLDEAIGSRIYERSRGHRLVLENKPNWRLSDSGLE